MKSLHQNWVALLVAFAVPNTAIHGWRLSPARSHSQYSTNVSSFHGPQSSILQHPADWSRNIQPIPVHSHNDYWRDVPVLDALAHGVRSIESDIWLNPDDDGLYVGHDPFSLSKERTFERLTIQPLKAAVDQANAANHLHSSTEEANFFANLQRQEAPTVNESQPHGASSWSGFYSAGVGLSAPLQLLVDIKTDGNQTFPHLLKAIDPLLKKGYLTYYDADTDRIVPGPLLIIGTGSTPAATLASSSSPRGIFLDCPLGDLDKPLTGDGETFKYDEKLCGIASADWKTLVPKYAGLQAPSEAQRKNLTDAIQQAHQRNIPTRIWDTPFWPKYARDRVNSLLLELGSDWINADDLDAIARF